VGGRRQSRRASGGAERLCCLSNARRAVDFDLDQRARVRSFVWIMHCALLAKRRSWSFRAGQT
jgi:hypothetical protein